MGGLNIQSMHLYFPPVQQLGQQRACAAANIQDAPGMRQVEALVKVLPELACPAGLLGVAVVPVGKSEGHENLTWMVIAIIMGNW